MSAKTKRAEAREARLSAFIRASADTPCYCVAMPCASAAREDGARRMLAAQAEAPSGTPRVRARCVDVMHDMPQLPSRCRIVFVRRLPIYFAFYVALEARKKKKKKNKNSR